MEVRCDKCQARYRVDGARIGPQGLTMRCGKCQNTFKVLRAAESEPAPPPRLKPPPAPPAKVAQTTMMFAAPAFPAAPAAKPLAAAPATAPPRSPAAPAAPAPPAGEAAGRTMMFQTGKLKAAAPSPAKNPQPPPAGTGTVVFSQPPVARPPAAKPAPTSPNAVRSTLPFGMPSAPNPVPNPPPAPAPEPVAEPVAPVEERAAESEAPPEPAPSEAPPEPPQAAAEQNAAEPEQPAREPGTFDKAPPRGLIIGVAAGLVLLLLIGAGLVAYRKLSRPPPAAAAVEALAAAQADADKDSLASIASAESKARDAVEVAGPRARFPQATALLARVQIQWADALEDQASQLADKGGDEGRVAQLQAQAKAKLKSAFELLSPALKASKDSPDLQLAVADYYRAQRLPSSMNRYLAGVKDDPRASLIQGMAAAQDEEGAARAVPLLKAALSTSPQSARIQYRLALAYLAGKDEASARAALNEALRLSPQHERARATLAQLGPPGTAGQK